jgi:hypothetical protein
MAKIIRIENCDTCPNFSDGDTEWPDCCTLIDQDITDDDEMPFPDWCPLEDAPGPEVKVESAGTITNCGLSHRNKITDPDTGRDYWE